MARKKEKVTFLNPLMEVRGAMVTTQLKMRKNIVNKGTNANPQLQTRINEGANVVPQLRIRKKKD